MSEFRDRDDHRLRSLLRAGDPAADGSDPSPGEAVRWKRRILNAAPIAAAPRWLPAGLAAAAAGSILVAFLWLTGPSGDRDISPGTASPGPAAGAPTGLTGGRHARNGNVDRSAARTSRTIHFHAPNGTRIIWTLDPDFSLPETLSREPIEGETS
jgi:hypothetical protein